jgi:glycosyltransferase involved in cell wall biosynthesis
VASPKRITFVLPGLFVAGGIRYVFNIATQLVAKGCDVKIVYPRQLEGRLWRMLGPGPARLFSRLKGTTRGSSEWLSTGATLLEVPALQASYLPDSDCVFATAWATADLVNSLPTEKGEKCYLLQHYETWTGPIEAVDATWRLPLRKIVVAQWLADLARDKFGDPDARVVNLGVDTDVFHVEQKSYNQRPRVMMLYHHQEWKGCADGLKAIALARGSVDFDLVLFGAHEPKGDIPADTEFHFNPAQDDLCRLYCSCDVFVSPSWLEGGPMPPMEAMACGCAVVASNSRGIVEYAIHDENALLSEPKHPESLAADLIRVISDRDLMQRLGKNGMCRMELFTWERSAGQMLAALGGAE